jgi:hypothetical protein
MTTTNTTEAPVVMNEYGFVLKQPKAAKAAKAPKAAKVAKADKAPKVAKADKAPKAPRVTKRSQAIEIMRDNKDSPKASVVDMIATKLGLDKYAATSYYSYITKHNLAA